MRVRAKTHTGASRVRVRANTHTGTSRVRVRAKTRTHTHTYKGAVRDDGDCENTHRYEKRHSA